MKLLRTISKWLVLIGAVNWGLVGLFNFNLVSAVLGSWPALTKWAYILVGVAGTWGVLAKFGVAGSGKK
ncbi:DUF378 domain-containing protein [Candidatus Collierbacteria bacterium]|nr:DUF378 domain-containing protein [Candidatus Collierbacteria bacterium]